MTGFEPMRRSVPLGDAPGAAPTSLPAARTFRTVRGDLRFVTEDCVVVRSEAHGYEFHLVEHPGQYPVKVWREQP